MTEALGTRNQRIVGAAHMKPRNGRRFVEPRNDYVRVMRYNVDERYGLRARTMTIHANFSCAQRAGPVVKDSYNASLIGQSSILKAWPSLGQSRDDRKVEQTGLASYSCSPS